MLPAMMALTVLSVAVTLVSVARAAYETSSFELLNDIEAVSDQDFYQQGRYSESQVALGQALFFDKILSGNQNVSCSSCHDPRLGTSDAIALSLGEGAEGLGPDRRVLPDQPISDRVPRNSQALYFLGAREFDRLFHDGRVSKDPNNNWDSGFWSPAREVATAVALDELDGADGAWALLARRLQAIPEYVERFRAAYAHIEKAEDISFVDAANAIAAFEAVAFRADLSPFDEFLRDRDPLALSLQARRGMALFYGEANCAACHSGKFQTDQDFHAIGMPQIGPGKSDGWDTSYWQATGYMARLEDHGRARETARPRDKFAFRTPTLRNVALTAPYGHSGAYNTLEEVIAHHIDPVAALDAYRTEEAALPKVEHVIETTVTGSQLIYKPVNPARLDDFQKRDTWVMNSMAQRNAIAQASELEPVKLSAGEIADLVAFMNALTDPRFVDPADLVPDRVPSGLAIDHPRNTYAMSHLSKRYAH
jgi:cytochrome c peroxidase